MKYGSVCSGIEAATVAWHGMGLEPAWFAEVEAFPKAVLAHHYPGVLDLGDMTKLHERKEFNGADIDVLVGGTPCQSFSVAGLRQGLADPRGNLALHFLKIIDAKRPRWVVWENVSGVLSSWSAGTDGRGFIRTSDFDTFTSGLGQLGYGVAWRILDAQYFGVPQRRRRVFVVGYFGDWRPAAAVLFERQSLSGNPPPSRSPGQGFTHELAPSIGASGRGFERGGETRGQDPVIAIPIQEIGKRTGSRGKGQHGCGIGDSGDSMFSLQANAQHGVAHPLLAKAGTRMTPGTDTLILDDRGGSQMSVSKDGKVGSMRSQQHQHQPIIFQPRSPDGVPRVPTDGQSPTLDRMGGGQREPCVALPTIVEQNNKASTPDMVNLRALETPNTAIQTGMLVRRLTPCECERLQGFPDDYTLIPYRGKPAADGPRYKALGNSMAVPVMRWIGKRIVEVEKIVEEWKE